MINQPSAAVVMPEPVQAPPSLPSPRSSDNFFQALAHAYANRVSAAVPNTRQTPRYASANIPAGPGMTPPAEFLPMASGSGTTGTIDATSAPGSTASVRAMIVAAASQESIPAKLLSAVVQVESGYQPRAQSPVGAKGLTQLMDGTAKGLGVTDSFDPWQNLVGGARFLRGLLNKYNGNMTLAVAAYNAGPGAVDAYGGNVPPYAETQKYVKLVLGIYHKTGGDQSVGGTT